MPKNILYLSPYFWPEEIGSAPYCTEIAVWLQEKGHTVKVVAFRPHYPNISQFLSWNDGSHDEEIYENMRITRVPVGARSSGSFKDRIRNDIRFLWLICRQAMGGRFRGVDTVVAYVPSILSLFGASLIRLVTGARIVGVVHDIESGLAQSLGIVKSNGLIFVMRLIERFGLNRADEIIVLTEGMRLELQGMGCRCPISVISIWASLPPSAPVPSSFPPILMYSGNFGKKQKLEQLLPLIKRLSEEKRPIQIVMRGDGLEKQEIEKMFLAAKITNTRFLPLVAAKELFPTLQSANIHLIPQAPNVAKYALPSKTFSIMAAGRPFVCIAEQNSPLDILSKLSAAGICVEPGNEDALFHTIINLADDIDDQRRKGENGRRFVSQHMKKETIMQAYYAIIVGT